MSKIEIDKVNNSVTVELDEEHRELFKNIEHCLDNAVFMSTTVANISDEINKELNK